MAPPQCQVERHTIFKNDNQYEWADFRARREPMPWNEVARMKKKVNPRKKLTASCRKLEPRTAATLQPAVQAPKQIIEGKGRIRFALQANTGNRTASKWKRKLGNRLKKKQASSTMWHDVDTKWYAHQETLKTKAVHQEVEQISEVVNLMQTQENEFNKLMEEINSLDCSIDASIT